MRPTVGRVGGGIADYTVYIAITNPYGYINTQNELGGKGTLLLLLFLLF